MAWTVYKHETPDGKVYIGATSQSIEKRWKAGYRGGRFRGAVEAYGWEGMAHDVLCEGLTQEQASQ
jgi:hypothetical protein